jgi:hypothetical protein
MENPDICVTTKDIKTIRSADRECQRGGAPQILATGQQLARIDRLPASRPCCLTRLRAYQPVSMRWFRSNRHFGTRLALIAVALQFVLTFGHVHLAQAAAHHELSSTAAGPGGSDQSDRKPNGLAELDCPVCALIHLSAAAAPSAAPVLPLPAAEFVTLRPRADTAATAAPRISQRARAPPAA